jgi:hypothetical protein
VNERKDISNNLNSFTDSGGGRVLDERRLEKNNILVGSDGTNLSCNILGEKNNVR